MRRLFAFASFVCSIFLLAGCGSSDVDSIDTDAPLEGDQLSRAKQLEGTWIGITEGDYVGFEFLADGQVLATFNTGRLAGTNASAMLRYTVLEGGRLSLIAPDGQSQVYTAQIAGSQLELSGRMALSNTDSQRFRRLAKGQTLEQGLEEQRAARVKAYEERLAAVTVLLAQSDLVIRPTAAAPNAPPAIAVAADGGATGSAWHDDAPPHRDEIGFAVAADDKGETPVVNVTFGRQLEPAPTQQRNPATISFAMSGNASSPVLRAPVNFGGQRFELEIVRDSSAHKAIVGRFDAEVARIAQLRAPLTAALSDYAVLEGESSSQNRPAPTRTRIILVKNAATGGYTGEATLIEETGQSSGGPVTSAEILVTGDNALLMVNVPGRQYQLSLEPGTKRLTGGWFLPGNSNGWAAALEVKQSLDAATRERQVQAERQALASLDSATPLLGLVETRIQFLPQPTAMALAIGSGNGGQITGTATFPIVAATVDVQGQIVETLAGPRLQLRFTGLRESGSSHATNLFSGVRSLVLNYAVAGTGDSGRPLELTDGAHVLTQSNEAYRTGIRRQLMSALANGLEMQLTHPVRRDVADPITLRFTSEAGGTRIGGGAVRGTMPNGFHDEASVDGELEEIAGFPVLRVEIAHPPPARPRDFRRVFAAEMIAYPTPEGWSFTAPFWPTNSPQGREYAGFAEVR